MLDSLFDDCRHILQRGHDTERHDIFIDIELGIVMRRSCTLFGIVDAEVCEYARESHQVAAE